MKISKKRDLLPLLISIIQKNDAIINKPDNLAIVNGKEYIISKNQAFANHYNKSPKTRRENYICFFLNYMHDIASNNIRLPTIILFEKTL
jgi:hypothetical protein